MLKKAQMAALATALIGTSAVSAKSNQKQLKPTKRNSGRVQAPKKVRPKQGTESSVRRMRQFSRRSAGAVVVN
jgi:hypothetical protein